MKSNSSVGHGEYFSTGVHVASLISTLMFILRFTIIVIGVALMVFNG